MNKKNITLFKKFCAVITTVCFTFTIVSNNLFAAANIDTLQSKKQYFEAKGSAGLDSLFSSKYGKIVSYSNNLSDTVVINIQDLHCDYSVQKNIYFLIDEISKKYNIDKVYVEGGIGNIDTSFFANINSQYKQDILERMLKDSKLTGTEYYSAMTDKVDLLKGVEEKDVYLKNIVRLNDIINSKKETSVYLAKIENEIDLLKSKYLKSKNKDFDKLLKQSENKEISQDQFIIELFNYAKNNNISLKNYENLQIYLSLFNYSVNNKKVQKELVNLLKDIKQSLTYREYNEFVNLTSNLTDIQKISFFAKKLCDENNISLSKVYPNLNKVFELKEKSVKCNPIELVKEERKLIDVLRTYLSETETELEITYLCDFEHFYKDYLSASLTASQWEYVKLGLDKFKELYAKYSISNDIEKLEKYSNLLTEFYDVNTERNEIFIKKMGLSNNSVANQSKLKSSNFLSPAKKIVVLVAGGYHTDGINEILNQKGYSTITITPNIANSTKESRIEYEYLAQQQAMSIRQMIALGLISNASPKDQVLSVAASLLKNQNLDGININILVQQLNQLFSQDITISLIEEGKQLEVTFEDGSTQIIDVEEDIAKIVQEQDMQQLPARPLVQVPYEKLQDILTGVSGAVTKATLNYGTGIVVPQVYQISKDVCLFMIENKLYLGNGAVWEIANSEYNGQTLNGVEPVVYEYMPEFMQRALASRQATIDDKNKRSLSKKILSKIFALIITVALLFNMTGCNIKQQETLPNETLPASTIEIDNYTEEVENVMAMFQSGQGYYAYLPSFMTQDEKSEWGNKDLYYVDGLINTFDQANAAILYLKMGENEKAREVLLTMINNNFKEYEITRVSGRKETLYRIYKSNRESGEILGEIVWVGLAAVQYKLATGSNEFDNLIKTVDEYLVSRECVEGAGYYMGSSVMYFTSGGYSSSEHQLDIMAYFTLKNLLPDSNWKGIIPEHIVAKVLPNNVEFSNATDEQISKMIEQAREENANLLFNACKAFYKNMYKNNGIVRGYNDYFLVLDANSWGVQVLLMVKEYAPSIHVEEKGAIVEKSIYEASELSKIDLNSLLEKIEKNFYVTDEELKENLSKEDYQRFKGYHLYTWSKEKFVDGKLNWSFEWSMQVATAYYLMGNYEQAQLILEDAKRFAKDMGLYNGLLPASNVNAVRNYSDYGWKIPRAPSFAATITSLMLEYGMLNADPTYSSPFFPVVDQEEIPSSILPSTIQKINNMITSGLFSIKKALVEILNKETFKSFFRPVNFVKEHINTKGAKILTIATAIAFFVAFGMSMLALYGAYSFIVQTALSLAASLVAAFDVNVGTHIIIDYRYLKSVGLAEAVKLYGKENVKVHKDGSLSVNDKEKTVPIYVINDKPKNAAEFNFKSVPVKVRTQDGRTVKCWIGNYNGAAVLFADGADYETVVRDFGKTRQFETVFGRRTALKANVDVIEIDMNNPDSGLNYSQSGNVIVGANMVKTENVVDLQKEISLLKNKAIEAVTINQNVAVYIDDAPETVSVLQDFIDTVNLYVKNDGLGTNVKILFNDKFFTGDKVNGKKGFLELLEQEYGNSEAADKEFIRIIEQLKQENKEIVVVFDESEETTNLNKYRRYGIFSYIANNEYVDGITATKTQTKFVTNLNQIYGFDGSLSIIKVSAFKEELAKSSGIFTFLTSSLNLNEYLKTRSINFIKQVASNFDFDQIPVMDVNIIGQILTSSQNKFEDLSKYLSGTDSVTMYYLGLSDDEQRAVFMEELLKRALVINYLRSLEQDNAYYGLKDKNLENVLANALFERYMLKKNFDVITDVNLGETGQTTAAEIELKLLQTISQLSQKAFEEKDPKSIDDIIKLIPLYAERNIDFRTATNIDVMEIKNIKGILSAA